MAAHNAATPPAFNSASSILATRFLQLAIRNVVPKPGVQPTTMLTGVEDYNPDQIRVEPKFSPDNDTERRAVLQTEAPSIEHFEYADAPGYAVIKVDGTQVQAEIYANLNRQPWKTLELSALLAR